MLSDVLFIRWEMLDINFLPGPPVLGFKYFSGQLCHIDNKLLSCKDSFDTYIVSFNSYSHSFVQVYSCDLNILSWLGAGVERGIAVCTPWRSQHLR